MYVLPAADLYRTVAGHVPARERELHPAEQLAHLFNRKPEVIRAIFWRAVHINRNPR